jgi:hypothetical protein
LNSENIQKDDNRKLPKLEERLASQTVPTNSNSRYPHFPETDVSLLVERMELLSRQIHDCDISLSRLRSEIKEDRERNHSSIQEIREVLSEEITSRRKAIGRVNNSLEKLTSSSESLSMDTEDKFRNIDSKLCKVTEGFADQLLSLQYSTRNALQTLQTENKTLSTRFLNISDDIHNSHLKLQEKINRIQSQSSQSMDVTSFINLEKSLSTILTNQQIHEEKLKELTKKSSQKHVEFHQMVLEKVKSDLYEKIVNEDLSLWSESFQAREQKLRESIVTLQRELKSIRDANVESKEYLHQKSQESLELVHQEIKQSDNRTREYIQQYVENHINSCEGRITTSLMSNMTNETKLRVQSINQLEVSLKELLTKQWTEWTEVSKQFEERQATELRSLSPRFIQIESSLKSQMETQLREIKLLSDKLVEESTRQSSDLLYTEKGIRQYLDSQLYAMTREIKGITEKNGHEISMLRNKEMNDMEKNIRRDVETMISYRASNNDIKGLEKQFFELNELVQSMQETNEKLQSPTKMKSEENNERRFTQYRNSIETDFQALEERILSTLNMSLKTKGEELYKEQMSQFQAMLSSFVTQESLEQLQSSVNELLLKAHSDQSEELNKLKTTTNQLQTSFNAALKQTGDQFQQLRGNVSGVAKESDVESVRGLVRQCEESIRQLQESKNEPGVSESDGVVSGGSSSSELEELKSGLEQLKATSSSFVTQESLEQLQSSVNELLLKAHSDQSEELNKLKTTTNQLQTSFNAALKQTGDQFQQLRGNVSGVAKESDVESVRELVRQCEESIRQLQESKNEPGVSESDGVVSGGPSSSELEELTSNLQRLQTSFNEALKQTKQQFAQLDLRETVKSLTLSMTAVEDGIELLQESLHKYLTISDFNEYKLAMLATRNDSHSPRQEEWSELVDDSTGAIYYYNNVTGASQWSAPAEYEPAPHPPRSSAPAAAAASGLQLELQKLKALFESKIEFFGQEMEYLKENIVFTQNSFREQIDQISTELSECRDQISEFHPS